jgi:hypothetical protein
MMSLIETCAVWKNNNNKYNLCQTEYLVYLYKLRMFNMQTDFTSGVLAPWCWIINSFAAVGLTSDANSYSASQICPSFCGTRRFITVFTIARHLSLSWARLIQSTISVLLI